jgi:hypothetical protein
VFCPLHPFSPEECIYTCELARKELQKLNNDYRQYWFDRRHGVKPMSPFQYQLRYGTLEHAADRG